MCVRCPTIRDPRSSRAIAVFAALAPGQGPPHDEAAATAGRRPTRSGTRSCVVRVARRDVLIRNDSRSNCMSLARARVQLSPDDRGMPQQRSLLSGGAAGRLRECTQRTAACTSARHGLRSDAAAPACVCPGDRSPLLRLLYRCRLPSRWANNLRPAAWTRSAGLGRGCGLADAFSDLPARLLQRSRASLNGRRYAPMPHDPARDDASLRRLLRVGLHALRSRLTPTARPKAPSPATTSRCCAAAASKARSIASLCSACPTTCW